MEGAAVTPPPFLFVIEEVAFKLDRAAAGALVSTAGKPPPVRVSGDDGDDEDAGIMLGRG